MDRTALVHMFELEPESRGNSVLTCLLTKLQGTQGGLDSKLDVAMLRFVLQATPLRQYR